MALTSHDLTDFHFGALLEEGQTEEAFTLYKNGYRPQSPHLLTVLACLLGQRNDYEAMFRIAKEGKALFPDSFPFSLFEEIYAGYLWKSEKYHDFHLLYQTGFTPSDPNLFFGLAYSEFQLGHFDLMLSLTQQGAKLFPDDKSIRGLVDLAEKIISRQN